MHRLNENNIDDLLVNIVAILYYYRDRVHSYGTDLNDDVAGACRIRNLEGPLAICLSLCRSASSSLSSSSTYTNSLRARISRS